MPQPLPPFHALPLVNPDLSIYLVGDESVVFARSSQCLYGLDPFATAVLLALDQGLSSELETLRGAPGFEAVASAVEALLRGAPSQPPGVYAAVRDALPPPPAVSDEGGFAVGLLGTRFLLRLADVRAVSRVLPPLRHLVEEAGPVDIVVDVTVQDGHYRLAFNGMPQGGPLSAERLFPMLLDRMRSLAYQGTDYLLAVHGAVVARGRHGMLLPGQSGAGKSTLTATLVAHGYRLLTDEAAVLERVSCRALAVPLAIGLKAGSWPVVQALFPGFEAQAVHERWDGLALRYLLPGPARRARESCAIRHVIFPRFEAGAALAVKALSPVEALRRMTEAGYQIKDRLDGGKVEQLLHWLTGLRCSALRYGSTADALRGVDLCQGGEGPDV